MIGVLTALTAIVLTAATASDNTIAVKPGARLTLVQFTGSIAVQTWSRSAVRVVADHGSRVKVELDSSGTSLRVKAESEHGVPAVVDYRITVPVWMALDLSGVTTEISVVGSAGDLRIDTVEGEITVKGGARSTPAGSTPGGAASRSAGGKVVCSTVNGSIHVERVSGPVVASTVNGEIVLDRIESSDVEATTINGAMTYEGAIKDAGSYRFNTHNGDVEVSIAENANARVSVATFGGEFTSSFPLKLSEARRDRRLNFTLGSGSALVEIESFQGTVRLRRPAGAGKERGER